MTEREFQSQVIQLAHLCGWRVCHFRPARMEGGKWRTPVEGDPGFPDLVLARDGRVIFAEIKLDGCRLNEAQYAWLADIGGFGRLWHPSDWQEIVDTLRR